MKILSWNLNGIRTLENFKELLLGFDVDVACFQETKVSRNQLGSSFCKVDGYVSFYAFPKVRVGQSGVCSYFKKSAIPKSTDYVLDDQIDLEGRVLITYHHLGTRTLTIINVYIPCGYENDEDPIRFNTKISFLKDLKRRVASELDKNNSVIVLGDMNVKTSVLDSADALEKEKKHQSLVEWSQTKDKVIFREILDLGLVDAFRHLHPNQRNVYTCWNSGTRARVNNFGTRIDYILTSKDLRNLIVSFSTLTDCQGSDHCPIVLTLEPLSITPSPIIPNDCTLYFPEISGRQSSVLKHLHKVHSTVGGVETSSTKTPTSRPLLCLATKTLSKKRRSASTGSELKKLRQTTLLSRSVVPLTKATSTQSSIEVDQPPTEAESSVAGATSISSTILQKSCSSETTSKNTKLGGARIDSKSVTSCPPCQGAGDPCPSLSSILVGLPKPPLCSEHGLKSHLKTVSKVGINHGRRFYCCPLPIGPSGEKSSRCNFFMWFDEYNRRRKK